jgi:hypothetical protein
MAPFSRLHYMSEAPQGRVHLNLSEIKCLIELARIDPATDRVQARVRIPAGSVHPAFANGYVWIT